MAPAGKKPDRAPRPAPGPASKKPAAPKPLAGKPVAPKPPANKVLAGRPVAEKRPARPAPANPVAVPAAPKPSAKKAAAKKPSTKKPTSGKAAAKPDSKAVKKKAVAKKPVAKKAAPKKTAAKKAASAKAAPKPRAAAKTQSVPKAPPARVAKAIAGLRLPPASAFGRRAAKQPRPLAKRAPAPALDRPAAQTDAPTPASSEPAVSGNSRMVLMLRDPKWLCVYWELDPDAAARHRIGALVGAPLLIVRLHQPPRKTLDFTVFGQARTWYVPVDALAEEFRAELGYIGGAGRFVSLVASNPLTAVQPQPKPRSASRHLQASPATDEQPAAGWAASHDDPHRESTEDWRPTPHRFGDDPDRPFDELPFLSERPERFPGASEHFLSRLGERLVPGGASEIALAPPPQRLGASEMLPSAWQVLDRPRGQRGFWLHVATELILYGATEPDARVTVAGEPVALREDGAFTLRYALPDGRIELPVRAVSADGEDERAIEPVVEKQTH